MSADQSSNERDVLERAWATLLERRSLQMSLDEVAAALGTTPDLVSTKYGGSEQLFLRAFEYHAERFVAQVHAVLSHRDVKEAVRAFVELTASLESRGSAVLRCCPTPAADGTDPEACPIRRGISDLIQTLDTLLISRLGRPDGQVPFRVARSSDHNEFVRLLG